MKLQSVEPIKPILEYEFDDPVMRAFLNCQIGQSEDVYLQVSPDNSNVLSIDLDSAYLFISSVEVTLYTGPLDVHEPVKCPESPGMPLFQNMWDIPKSNGKHCQSNSRFSLAVAESTLEIKLSNLPDAMGLRSSKDLFFSFDDDHNLNKIIFQNIPREYIAHIQKKWGKAPTAAIKS